MATSKSFDERFIPNIKHLWRKDVADHDYDAALTFLHIHVGRKRASALVARLRKADVVRMRANDVLRACDLEPLSVSDPGTHHNMVKTILGMPLSPVLVVSFIGGTSTIADGYHRVSWAYRISPWVEVPGKLVSER
jgi:hypothetical protein